MSGSGGQVTAGSSGGKEEAASLFCGIDPTCLVSWHEDEILAGAEPEIRGFDRQRWLCQRNG